MSDEILVGGGGIAFGYVRFKALDKHFFRHVRNARLSDLRIGILILKAGKHLTLVICGKADRMEHGNNFSLAVKQYDVAVRAHYLAYQILLGLISQLVRRRHGYLHCPIEAYLPHPRDKAAGELLSEKHTKHRRHRRVFPVGARKAHSCVSGACGEEQALCSSLCAYIQYYFIALRLIDLLYPCAERLVVQ